MVRRYIPFIILAVGLLGMVQITYSQDETGQLLARINALRSSLGLSGYSTNGALTAAAQQHAQWIAQTGSVSHTQADGSGPRSRALSFGYPTTDVTENIYGGTRATVDVAWSYWVNSSVHYRGLTHPAYQHVGVGVARSDWGTAYVLVFGNPGGPPPPPPRRVSDAGAGEAAGASGAGAAPVQPSYVVGRDERGNIMHEIQDGDTVGDIALIYGYSWDDLPHLMALNELADVTALEVGAIFLVPPHDGTYTPTPTIDIPPTNTRAVTPGPTHTRVPTNTPTDTPTDAPIATAGDLPANLRSTEAAEPMALAAAAVPTRSTEIAPPGAVTLVRSERSPWLLVAVLVQAGIVLAAGIEFIRRRR